MAIARAMLQNLGIQPDDEHDVPSDPGRPLERMVTQSLKKSLPEINPTRQWLIPSGRTPRITDYVQYRHLLRVDQLAATPELRITLGRDYLIEPDVCVGIGGGDETPFLHAAISCKWTIRSDRVQNIRHESNQMIRHRRARLPHLVTVTAEPLPSRLASIARGTGEVDAVYHIAFEELSQAVNDVANSEQADAWDESVGQGRLLPFDDLARTLACW